VAASRGLLTRLAAAAQLAAFVLFAAWAVWEGPLPLIKVRWSPGLPVEMRQAAERELDLQMLELTDPDTYQYELWSASPRDIAVLVRHPLVADTSGIDRQRFRIDHETAGVAPGRVWRGGFIFGGRDGARRFRLVFFTVTAAALLLAAVTTKKTKTTDGHESGR
jgi:hypothetical protein